MKKTISTANQTSNDVKFLYAFFFGLLFSISSIAQVDTVDYSFQNFQLTKDPTLGYPPYSRLNIVREKIFQNQTATGAIPNINWFERGPNNIGGRTRAIMFDPHINPSNDFKKVWAGGVGGGLWWTNDITANQPQWNRVNDLWDNMSISAITNDMFSINNDEYYCGTGEGWQMPPTVTNVTPPTGNGIWKSSNGGVTWNLLNSTVLDDVINNPNAYNFNYIQKIECKQVAGQIRGDVFVATKDNGVMRSHDGGTTWDIVLGQSFQSNTNEVSDIEIGADNFGVSNVYAALGMNYSQAGIYYSTTGDQNSWTLISGPGSGILQGFQRVNLCPSKTNPNKIYALVNYFNNGGITKLYVCTTIGTLNQWNLLPTLPLGYSTSNLATNKNFNQAIGIDPLNDQTIYIGSSDIYKSDDGGITFHKITSYTGNGLPSVHEGQNEILISYRNPSTAVICNNGGVYYSDDFSLSYPQIFEKNLTYNITQLYTCAMENLTSSNYYLAGPQDFPNLSSISPGISNVIQQGNINRVGGMCFIDQTAGESNIQITSDRFTDSFKFSTNGGASWAPFLSVPQTNCVENFISPADYDSKENTLFFLNLPEPLNPTGDECDYSYVARYTNVGASNLRSELNIFWTGIPFNLYNKQETKITHIKVLPNNQIPNTSTLFIGTDLGYVFKIPNIPNNSQNLNLTAYPILTPISGSFHRVVSSIDVGQDEDHLLVTFSNYGVSSVYETKNGGTTWEDKDNINLSSTLPDMPIYWGIYNPNNFNQVLLATELGVWSTDDISANPVQWGFDPNSGIPKVRVYQLRTRTSDNLILAATHGRGLWATDIFNQPIAGFNYSQPTPCSLHYEFTNTSVPANCTYLWDFGDGSTSTVANPTHVYGSPGNYIVNLTVTNSSGNNTSSQTINIDLSSCCTGDVYLEDGRNASHYLTDLNGPFTTFVVKGKFTFDNAPGVNGMGLNGKVFIAMPGAEIIVEDGVKISANNCHFYACSDMWKGITTKSESTIYFDNCSIKDADKAISPYFQANFELVNCEFLNNIYGVYANNDLGYPNKEGNFSIRGCSFNFNQSLKLSYAGQSPFGTNPKAGIFMRFRHGNIGDNSSALNYFNELNTGIILQNSSINVFNASFNKILNKYFYAEAYMGSAIYAEANNSLDFLKVNGFNGNTTVINISNSDYGVYTENISSYINSVDMQNVKKGVFGTKNINQKSILVSNSNIHARLNGIHLLENPGASHIQIFGNNVYTYDSKGICILVEDVLLNQATTIEIIENPEIYSIASTGGIWVTKFVSPLIKWNNVFEVGNVQKEYSGILLTDCNKAEASCNNVLGSSIDLSKASSAIRLDQSTESIIHCNIVNNTNFGIAINGDCSSSDLADNEINDHEVGLKLNSVGALGVLVDRGNRWRGTYYNPNQFGAVNDNTGGGVIAYLFNNFRVHTPDPNASTPAGVDNYFPNISVLNKQNGGWFRFVAGGGPFLCSSSDECNPDPINERLAYSNNQLELAIANGTYTTADYIPESKSIAKQNLFSRLTKDAYLLNQNSNFQTFYSTQQNGSIGILEAVKDDVRGLNYYTNYFKNALNNVTSTVNSLMDSIKNLDSLRHHTALSDSLIDSTLVILKNQLNTAQEAIHQIMLQQEAIRASSANIALSKNANIVSNEIPEINYKDVNEIYLNSVGAGNYNLNPSQIASLIPIAQQCPYSGGPAVYSARILLKLANIKLDYDDYIVCWSQGIYRKANPEQSKVERTSAISGTFKLSLAPNPASTELNIYYTGLNSNKATLEIVNLTGELVLKSIELPSVKTAILVNTSDLANGVYLVKVFENSQCLNQSKLVIVK